MTLPKRIFEKLIMNNKYVLAAFFLPVLITILGLAVNGIYPFGSNQIAVIDMYHQYVPFLSEYQHKLQTGGNLFYSWNGAGGHNFWNLLAYYGASPLNLLLALFPRTFVMEGITVILLIKIGLSGSFMFVNLRYQSELDGSGITGMEDKGMLTVAFSTLYALNSFVMGYYWCIMWIDAVMLLPLCIMGLKRIIAGKGIALYCIALAIVVWANYYISIMVCIFIMFYYPVLYFTRAAEECDRPVIACVKTTAKAVGSSFLGIAMSAAMLLPTYISMKSTFYISASMPEKATLYNDPLNILNQLLPNAQLTYREGLPNLYCGMLVVILLVMFVMTKAIPAREKMINGIFLVFMFFSLNINKLDFIWHGFHFPNQLPFRYTFVICFVLVGLAYRTMLHFDSIPLGRFYMILAVGFGYYLLAQKILAQKLDDPNVFFYVGVAALLVYITIFCFRAKGKITRGELIILVVAVVAAEMCINVCTSFDKVGNSSRESYQENYSSALKLSDYADSLDFARMEVDNRMTLDEPARLHYKGMSQFSSSINASTTCLMEEIGLEGEPGKNRFNYNLTNPVLNCILDVRYILSMDGLYKNKYYTEVKEAGNSKLLQSKYPLSIGYMTDESIRTWRYYDDNPFVNLEDYVRAATGQEWNQLFVSLGNPTVSSTNVAAKCSAEDYVDVICDGSATTGTVTLTYTADKSDYYYIFIESGSAETINVERRDPIYNMDIQSDCGSIESLGFVKKGEPFYVKLTYKPGVNSSIVSHVCTLNEGEWDKAYKVLSKDLMTVTDYGDNYLKGEITASEDGVFVTTIPYDKGWKMKVDGRERKLNDLTGDVWMSCALDKGEHEIEFYFRPPGFVIGVIISVVSIVLLVVLSIIMYARRRRADQLLSEYPEEEYDYNIEEEMSDDQY